MTALRLVVLSLLVAVGCASGTPRSASGTAAGEPQWNGCDESEADSVLVAVFDVRGMPEPIRQEVPIRRQPAGVSGVSGTSIDADGERGTGFGASLHIIDEPTPGVTLDASIYWTGDDGSGGSATGTITAPVGRVSVYLLSDSVKMTVSFRAPVAGGSR